MNTFNSVPETVLLIDVVFLNRLINDTRDFFEKQLNRKLADIDLSDLLTYLAMDAGMDDGEGDVQVMLITDHTTENIVNCNPSSLRNDLNAVAFRNHIGEFSINSYFPDVKFTREEYFLMNLTAATELTELKRIILFADEGFYGFGINSLVAKDSGKKIIRFRMEQAEPDAYCRWENMLYPVMQALGVTGDEISSITG